MTIRRFLHYTPQIAASAYIDPSAQVIGQVEVGADSSIWPLVVARGDINTITIGERSNIQDGSVLHVTHDHAGAPGGFPLRIGDQVTVGHNVTLHGCEIGDRCLIGIGSTILDGALLPPHTLIGAGSLVPPGKQLEGGYLWIGTPVRRVRPLTEVELAWFSYSADNYVRLQQQFRETERVG